MTQTTYEMIRALPGKGTNWPRLVDALRNHYFEAHIAKHGQEPWDGGSIAEWKSAKGVRQLREAAMQAACFAVHAQSRKSSFIPPSEEELQWGGFLGGEHVSWTDKDAEEVETLAIAEIIQSAK